MIAVLLTDQAAAHAARDQRDKAIATLQARAALAGFVLHITVEHERPAFVIVRWGWTKVFGDLDGVTAFLDGIRVP
jgi:hypothetical protein